jgi:hypothetical protein
MLSVAVTEQAQPISGLRETTPPPLTHTQTEKNMDIVSLGSYLKETGFLTGRVRLCFPSEGSLRDPSAALAS